MKEQEYWIVLKSLVPVNERTRILDSFDKWFHYSLYLYANVPNPNPPCPLEPSRP